jgi:hypothetical protein
VLLCRLNGNVVCGLPPHLRPIQQLHALLLQGAILLLLLPAVSTATHTCRNVTVTSVLGIDTILDLAYARSAVELCNTCTILFENMTIAGDRRSPGPEVDLFLGHPGSKVEYRNSRRYRVACSKAQDTASVCKFQAEQCRLLQCWLQGNACERMHNRVPVVTRLLAR